MIAHIGGAPCTVRSGLFSATGSLFLGCMIGIGTHTVLSQCAIAIVPNCSTILLGANPTTVVRTHTPLERV